MDSGSGQIYQPPQSDLRRATGTEGDGGSIERTLAGDFEFDILVRLFDRALRPGDGGGRQEDQQMQVGESS